MSIFNVLPGGLTPVTAEDLHELHRQYRGREASVERLWSPFDIRLMLHFCTNPIERFEQAHAPIYAERVQSLVDAGLVEASGGAASHIATDRGRALVEMWCETPVPVVRYLDPRLAL